VETKIPVAVAQAYKAWMNGVPFTTVKKKVKRPLMEAFQTIGKATWKQLTARRRAALVKQRTQGRKAA